jgi:hypothetical protein
MTSQQEERSAEWLRARAEQDASERAQEARKLLADVRPDDARTRRDDATLPPESPG